MKKTTKGALAAGAAAVLLLGGAGSLAYWTADGTVPDSDINSGSLTMSVGTCSGWSFASSDTETPTGAATLLVPGDTVQETCSATINGTGDHLRATVGLDPATVPANLTIGTAQAPATTPDQLTISAAVTDPAAGATGVPITGPTPVTVTITVQWPLGSENNGSQLSTATLSGIALQAQQVHS